MWWALADAALKMFRHAAEGKAKQAQAKAQKTADDERFNNDKAYWTAREGHRATGVEQAQGLLSGLQGSLGGGAPNYTLSTPVAEKMKEARPYPGSHTADPTKGATWNLLAGLAGGGADITTNGALGSLLNAPRSPKSNSAGTSANPVQDLAGYDGRTGAAAFGGGDDRARVCALAPSLPGCPSSRLSDPGVM